MTSDSTIRRRVGRLENETDSIYELITDVRSRSKKHGHQLDRLTKGLDTHTDQLGLITQHLNDHDSRFDTVDANLAEVLRRLPEPA